MMVVTRDNREGCLPRCFPLPLKIRPHKTNPPPKLLKDTGMMEEVLPSASSECERLCSNQQRALVDCVDSIRRLHSDGGTNNDDTSATATTMTANTSCLPEAVMAWTRCCEEANLTGHKETWERELNICLFNYILSKKTSQTRLFKVRTILFYEDYIIISEPHQQY
jgi:hypothetical protein